MKEDPPSILQTQRFWDAFYVNDRVAEFRRRLYVEAYGEEYPADVGTDGYITLSELRQMADALHVGPGDKIADLGCGRGGPGNGSRAPPERPSWVSTFPMSRCSRRASERGSLVSPSHTRPEVSIRPASMLRPSTAR